MTIPSTPMSAGPFNTDGITTVFPFTYKSFGVGYHAVVKETGGTRTSLAYGTEFAVTQNSDQNANPGGNVIISPALPVGSTIEVYSNVPQEQPTQLPTGGRFNARVIMDALDRVVTLIKQGSGGGGALLPNDRSLRVPVGESINELGSAGSRANKLLAFDGAGSAVALNNAITTSSEGLVGVNNTAPTYPLDIRGAEPYVSVRKPAANTNFYGYNIMAGTDIVSAWLLNATTGRVQFTAGYLGYGGFFAFNTNGVDRVFINSNGTVDVNGSGAGQFLNAYGNSATTGIPASFNDTRSADAVSSDCVVIRRAGSQVGAITTTNTATAYGTSSDYRLKTVTGNLQGSGAFIDALQPRVGTWNADNTTFVGFVAHELAVVSPSSVTGEKDGARMQAVAYGSPELIANMVAELKSLRARVAALEP